MFYKIISESLIKQPSYLGKGFPSNRELKKMRDQFDEFIYIDDSDKKTKKDDSKEKEKEKEKNTKDKDDKESFFYPIKKIYRDTKSGIKQQLSNRKHSLSEIPYAVKTLASSRDVSSFISSAANTASHLLDAVYGGKTDRIKRRKLIYRRVSDL